MFTVTHTSSSTIEQDVLSALNTVDDLIATRADECAPTGDRPDAWDALHARIDHERQTFRTERDLTDWQDDEFHARWFAARTYNLPDGSRITVTPTEQEA